MRYKTKGNLEYLWEKYDNMQSEWYNALEMISEMRFKNEEEKEKYFNLIDRVDISILSSLKYEIEKLIEEKGDSNAE